MTADDASDAPGPEAASDDAATTRPRRRRRTRTRKKPGAIARTEDGAGTPADAAPDGAADVSPDPEGAVAVAASDAPSAGTAQSDADPTAPNDGTKPRRRRRRRRSGSKPGVENDAGPEAEATGDPAPAAGGADRSGPSEPEIARGVLELSNKSDGRLRTLGETYVNDPDDPVIGGHLIERHHLRPGLELEVTLGKPFGGGGGGFKQRGKFKSKPKRPKANAIAPTARRAASVLRVDGMPVAEMDDYQSYEELTTIMPQPRLTLEYPGCPPACRLIDLFCPIGLGTRGMIVSPPKAGKTTLMQQIATAISRNHPEVEVYALLIDERPEEVTDFRRNVPCTVWASSNDHPLERHVGLAQLAIERCKRHAEMGKDVVVLLDSLTRLGRAFNTAPGMQGTGRTLSGGLDAGALAIPKQLFGGARKFEEGGSLTIVASALVDTGSRGDQVIFEEFKGTGNMEVILDRKIAETRTFPAIDLAASGTRNEDLLLTDAELETVTALRRRLGTMQPVTQIDQLLKALQRYETNAEMVGDSQKNPQARG